MQSSGESIPDFFQEETVLLLHLVSVLILTQLMKRN